MTTRRLTALAATAVTTFTLAACGAVPDRAPAAPAPRTEPVAAVAATPNCPDGKPAVASTAPGGSVASLRQKAVQSTLNRQRLVVGTSADVLLWGARDPGSGQLAGFDISLAHELARALFGNPNAVEFRVINYNQRLPALGATPIKGEAKASPVDVVLHTMTINCARWARVAFSSEYYAAGQKILVRADNPTFTSKGARMQITDLPQGSLVCVPSGSTNQEKLATYKKLKAVPVDDIGECLVKFQRGEVDAITGDDTVLAGFAAQDRYAKVVGDKFTSEPYGVGVGKRKTDLVRFVNAVLEQMRTDGRWTRIYGETMGTVQPPISPPPVTYGR
jgi:polar amino acid transport system substrate-binding protein